MPTMYGVYCYSDATKKGGLLASPTNFNPDPKEFKISLINKNEPEFIKFVVAFFDKEDAEKVVMVLQNYIKKNFSPKQKTVVRVENLDIDPVDSMYMATNRRKLYR